MEVLLINPKNVGYGISLGYIGATLKEDRHNVNVIDHTFVEDLEGEIRKIKPDIVGISFPTERDGQVKEIAKLCKKINKDIKVVVGGPHPSAIPKEVASIDNIDFVVYGEGEYTMRELARKIESNSRDLKKIKGIAFKNGDKVVVTRPRELIANLDEIPMPHDMIPIEQYAHHRIKYAHVFGARGCPFYCSFCPVHKVFGRKVRFHSIDRIIQELKYLYYERGVKALRFNDPTFNFDRDRVIDLCRRIVEERFKIKWVALGRIDLFDEEMLRWMKKAGCYRVECGIESGNQEMQRTMGKSINLKIALKNCKLVREAGIELLLFFIIGLPGETYQTVLETIDFAVDSGCEAALFALATPYPGTRLYDWAKNNDYLVHENWDQYKKNIPLIETPQLSGEDLIRLRRLAYNKFYFRPFKIWSIIKSTRLFEFMPKLQSLYFYKDLKRKIGFEE